MTERRSIQDIIPPARSKPLRTTREEPVAPPKKPASTPPPVPPQEPPVMPSSRPKRNDGRRAIGTLIAIALVVVVIIGGIFAVANIFLHQATVTISVKEYTTSISDTFEASPTGVLLSFSQQSIEETQSRAVQRTGTAEVEEYASGTITIFNANSESTQRLITNTRFQTENGLVYRIKSPVVVPGYTQSGGQVVPGSIEVTVYADEPGAQYNIGITDFVLPALLENGQQELYETITARSQTPMSGGFIGEKAIVDEAVRDAAVLALRADLDREVRAKFSNLSSEGAFVADSLLNITFTEEPDAITEDGATVTVKAIASAPLFENQVLAKLFASQSNVTFDGALEVVNLNDLLIEVVESETEGNLTVTVSGEPLLRGVFDGERLVADLAGKDQQSIGVVLTGYPAIEDMRVSVYPFWRTSIPEDTDKLSLEIEEGVDE